MYGPKTVLKVRQLKWMSSAVVVYSLECGQEAVIVPLEHQAFPDAEWLIGNHSDELTPWIPLLAAR